MEGNNTSGPLRPPANRQQTIQTKIKCARCKEFKFRVAYSENQLALRTAAHQEQNGRVDIICRDCLAGQELFRCDGPCGKRKSREDFSKAGRKGDQWICRRCTAWNTVQEPDVVPMPQESGHVGYTEELLWFAPADDDKSTNTGNDPRTGIDIARDRSADAHQPNRPRSVASSSRATSATRLVRPQGVSTTRLVRPGTRSTTAGSNRSFSPSLAPTTSSSSRVPSRAAASDIGSAASNAQNRTSRGSESGTRDNRCDEESVCSDRPSLPGFDQPAKRERPLPANACGDWTGLMRREDGIVRVKTKGLGWHKDSRVQHDDPERVREELRQILPPPRAEEDRQPEADSDDDECLM